MRIFIFLMIPLLASCLVEEAEPETSEVRFDPPPAKDSTVSAIFVLKGDKNNHIQVFNVLVDVQDGMPSDGEGMIQALLWNKNKKKFEPSSDDCVDRFDRLKTQDPNAIVLTDGKWRRGWEKNGEILNVTVAWDYVEGKKFLNYVSFEVTDENGVVIAYRPVDKETFENFKNSLPNFSSVSDKNRRELKDAILNDDDCIEGSPSGKETHRP